MKPMGDTLAIIGRVLADAMASPFSIALLLLLLLGISWQYHRTSRISGDLQEGSWALSFRAALLSTGLGLLGGVAGSFLMLWAGVDLSRIAIIPLWVVALLLMAINPRFLCFSYAGGLLGLSNLVFGYPDLSIPDLMALIAILHMIESLLILLDGRFFPIPVYVKRENHLCGGFNLQKFWPVLLVVSLQSVSVLSSLQNGWLNFLGTGATVGGIYTVLAVLGYGEVSTAFSPREKSRRSARRLFCFSLILLILTFLSVQIPQLLLITVLFSPLGHEVIIWLGLREEKRQPPIYTAPPQGVMILSTSPGSPAAKSGLQAGDIILRGNGRSLLSSSDLEAMMSISRLPLMLEGLHRGQSRTWLVDPSFGLKRSIVPAPGLSHPRYLTVPPDTIFNLASQALQTIRRIMHKSG